MGFIIGDKREVFRGEHLSVWETKFTDLEGVERTWEWLERKNAVFIFPITSGQRVVLVKNFRVPLERYVIEMPAGLKDRPGEQDEDTARRELLEETGYLAEKLIPIHPWPYRSGSSNGVSRGFIAVGLTKVKDAMGDATEDISIVEVGLEELMEFYFNLSRDILFDLGILAMFQIALHLRIRG